MNLASVSGSFSHIPLDWILLGALAIAITAYALYWGASRPLALSLAIPITYVLFVFIPHTAYLGPLFSQMNAGYSGAILVIVVMLILTICIDLIIREYSSSAAPTQALLVGIGTSIVLVVFWIQMSQLSALWHFSPGVLHIFGVGYAFYWLAAAYLLLALARR